MPDSKTVFVTGASGFIGLHLVRRLCEQGMSVRCLVRKNSPKEELCSLGVQLVEGDLSNVESLIAGVKEASIVFHIAGLTRSIRSNDFMRVNRDGCKNIAIACLENKKQTGIVPTLIAISSLAVAGPALKMENDFANESNDHLKQKSESNRFFERLKNYRYQPKNETDFPQPISPYGKSKWAGEQELLAFAAEYPISIVRPPFVFGEGDSLSLPLFKMVKKGPIFLIPGYFDLPFSFVHVSDLVEILLRVYQKGERLKPDSLVVADSQNRKNLVCSGQGIYYASHYERPLFSEFGKMLAEAVHRKKIVALRCPPLGVIGTGLIQEFWKCLTKHPVSLDWNKTIEALRGPWICSTEKLERSLDFRSTLSLQEQIQQTANWYFTQKWL